MNRSELHDIPQPKAGARNTDAALELTQAITALGGDTDYLIEALTQKIRSLRPVSTKSSLTGPERRFLINSGTFTEQELEETETAVGRGSLQLHEVQAWMTNLLDTLSAEEAANRLKLTDRELEHAVRSGGLLAAEVAGQLRYPLWQFVTMAEGRLLPGLHALIPELSTGGVLSGAAFMHSPMEELSGYGPRTPIQWLRDGGDVELVLELLRDDEIN